MTNIDGWLIVKDRMRVKGEDRELLPTERHTVSIDETSNIYTVYGFYDHRQTVNLKSNVKYNVSLGMRMNCKQILSTEFFDDQEHNYLLH